MLGGISNLLLIITKQHQHEYGKNELSVIILAIFMISLFIMAITFYSLKKAAMSISSSIPSLKTDLP